MCDAFAEPGGYRRTRDDTTAREIEYRRTLEETGGTREDTRYVGFRTVRPGFKSRAPTFPTPDSSGDGL